MGLFYDYSATTSTIEPVRFADSPYADDSPDWRSTHGMTMIFGQAACIWSSTKQRTTSTSTTEAEYVALCQAGKQLVWAKRSFQ